jgi:hypothetical protein
MRILRNIRQWVRRNRMGSKTIYIVRRRETMAFYSVFWHLCPHGTRDTHGTHGAHGAHGTRGTRGTRELYVDPVCLFCKNGKTKTCTNSPLRWP